MRYTEQQKELIAAARTGDVAGVRALADAGFDVDCELKYGSSALMIAASRGHEECVRALAAAGAKVNRRNRFGATALMEAVEKGHHGVIRALVENHAEINMPHNNGTTVLLAATFHRDVKTMKLLLDLGANPDIENFDGWSSKRWATSESNPALMEVFGPIKHEEHQVGQPVEGAAALESAADSATKVSVVTNDAFWTAFMRAASVGDVDTVRRLADEGVEINGQSPNGTTALIAAAKNGHTETVCELIELGADLKLTDGEGLSALAWASKKGAVMIVQSIEDHLKPEADLEKKDGSPRETMIIER